MARPELINNGKRTEEIFEAYLKWYGIPYKTVGQETWLPKWVHRKIAYNYSDDVEMIRHFPDYATSTTLINVKGALDCEKYPTVTIEQASYNTAKRLQDLEVPTYLFWLYPDNLFYGENVSSIYPEEPNTPRHETNGSMTPFFVIRKSQLKPLQKFIEILRGNT